MAQYQKVQFTELGNFYRSPRTMVFLDNCKLRVLSLLLCLPLYGAQYAAPAGTRPAIRRPGAATILPGGRVIAPMGHVHVTGPGAFGLAISPNGRTLVTSNGGENRYSLTILERDKKGPWTLRHLVAPKKEKGEPDDDKDE